MKMINNILKKNNLTPNMYRSYNNAIEVGTDEGKYIVKKNNHKEDIFLYLNNRNFNYYPDIIDSDEYVLTRYIENINIPDEQRILDLTDLVSLLHSKTTHYREILPDEYKKIYEDLQNNFLYLREYYTDIITVIDSKVFMSPSEYLLARNISIIFNSINLCETLSNEWIKEVEDYHKIRVSVVHNNLKLSHFIENDKRYLISWDKSKIDIPIFDLYNLYNNHYKDFEFLEILKEYEKTYPLKEYERNLLFILINMPSKLEFGDNEFNMTKKIGYEIERLHKSKILIEEYKKSIN